MSTKICQEYMTRRFAHLVRDIYGDTDDTAWLAKLEANARKPSGWARVAKFTVGSKVDVAGGKGGRTGCSLVDDFPHLRGWTCRIFLLKESDTIEIAIFEKDGVIADEFVDYSD